MPAYGTHNFTDEAWNAIKASSEKYNVPFGLMLSVNRFECPGCRVGDHDSQWGDRGIGGSYGLFQLYTKGFAAGTPIATMLDFNANADIAGAEMSRRYGVSGEWWDAIQPWSVRVLAWAHWKSFGDPESLLTPIRGGKPATIRVPIPPLPGVGVDIPTDTPQRIKDFLDDPLGVENIQSTVVQIFASLAVFVVIVVGLVRLTGLQQTALTAITRGAVQ